MDTKFLQCKLRSIIHSSLHYLVFRSNPPSPYEGLKIGSSLILADAGKTCTAPMRTWVESNDAGMVQPLRMLRLPSFFRRLYISYVRYIKRDEIYAGILDGWHEKKVVEFWPLVAKREQYKARWFDFWKEEELDFVLTVPNALPAVPHEGMKNGFSSCGYTFLFNLVGILVVSCLPFFLIDFPMFIQLDYSAGVLPVTHVDSSLDHLNSLKPRNTIERYAYLDYNAEDMHGLPVGVQIVGQRLEEEKVMEGMKIVEKLLSDDGLKYKLLKPI